MASTDTRLNIGVTTEGVEGIRKLADEVRQLGEQGSEAAPKFNALAADLDKLANQTAAINAVEKLNTELGQLSEKQAAAAAGVSGYRDKLDQLKAALTSAQAAQAEANADLTASKLATQEAADAISRHRAEASKDEQQTLEYATTLKTLKIAHLEARDAQRGAAAASDEAAAATKAAKVEMRAYADEVKTVEVPLKAVESAIVKKTIALDRAADALRKEGLETIDLAQAQAQVKTALVGVTAELEKQQAQAVTLSERKQQLAAIDAAVTQANMRNLALANAAARERGVIDERNAAAARSSAEAQAQAAAKQKIAADEAVANAHRVAQALKESSAATAAAFDTAFAGTGVRSTRAVYAEINQINAALMRLRADTSVTGAEFNGAFTAAKGRLAALDAELKGVGKTTSSLTSGVGFLKQGFQQFAAAYGLFETGRAFIDSNTQIEILRRTMTLATGSFEGAEQQLQLLKDTATTSGIAIGAISESFIKFQTAARLAGIEGSTVDGVFRSVTNAAGKLGLGGEKVNLILNALAQIASKGVVSMEELRQQLGDSLPGALGIASKGLGITDRELQKLVETGQLLSKDFLPGFKLGLEQTFGTGIERVEGFAASMGRLKTAMFTTFTDLGSNGAMKGLTAGVELLAKHFDTVIGGVIKLGEAFVAFKVIGMAREFLGIGTAITATSAAKAKDIVLSTEQAVATAVTTKAIEAETAAIVKNAAVRTAAAAETKFMAGAVIGLGNAYDTVKTKAAGAVGAARGMMAALGGPYGVALAATATFATELGNGIAWAAAKMTGSIGTIEKNEAALAKMSAAEKAAGAANAERAKVVTDTAVKINIEYNKLLSASEVQIAVSEKLVKAKKDEGKAAEELAKLSGDEAIAKLAAVKASTEQVAAIQGVLGAQKQEIAILEQQREKLVAINGAQEKWDANTVAFFKTFDERLAKKKADVEVTKQQAEAEKSAAAAAKLAAESMKDNSGRIEELKDNVVSARMAVDAMTQAFKNGMATDESVRQAKRNLAVEMGVLADAYDDATKAAERNIATISQRLSVGSQDIDLKRKTAEADYKSALALGEYTNKTDLAIKSKQLDIEQSRLKIEADTKIAGQLREQARLATDKLKVDDLAYASKKQAIEATLLAADAKEKEGLIEQQNARNLEIDLGKLNGTLNSTKSEFEALGGETRGTAEDMVTLEKALAGMSTNMRNAEITASNTADALKRVADSAQLASIATAYVNSPAYTLDKKRQAGTLTKDDQGLAQTNYNAALANLTNMQKNLGSFSFEGQRSFMEEYNKARMILEATKSAGQMAGIGGAPAQTKATATPQNSTTAGSTTHMVNITINGKTSSINAASAADAAALQNILNSIADAASRSGP